MKKTFSVAALILFAATAAAGSYPDILPKNFQNAPKKIICERESPTAVHENFYADPQNKWFVIVSGRDKKDLFILFAADGGKKARVEAFVLINGAWKNYKDLTEEERKYIDDEKRQWFAPEEKTFLSNCLTKGGFHLSIP